MVELYKGNSVLTIYPVVYPGFIQLMVINKRSAVIRDISFHLHLTDGNGRILSEIKTLTLQEYESKVRIIPYESDASIAVIAALFYHEKPMIVQREVLLDKISNLWQPYVWETILPTLNERKIENKTFIQAKEALFWKFGCRFRTMQTTKYGRLTCALNPLIIIRWFQNDVMVYSNLDIRDETFATNDRSSIYFALGKYSVHLTDQLELNLDTIDIMKTVDKVEHLIQQAGLPVSLKEIKRILSEHKNFEALSDEDKGQIDLHLHNLEMCLIKEV